MTTTGKIYAVVCFGSPAVKVPAYTRSLSRAKKLADAARGSGTCTTARVLECDTVALAKSADISRVRAGERTVYGS